jgi:tetratricopeptide (TPR) repeat protein
MLLAPPRLIRAVMCATALLVSAGSLIAQQARVEDAIRQLNADDAFRAVLTLNDVIAQNPGNAPMIARAHAVRAMAYLTMNQPERAKAAVDLAIKADPAFVPAAADLNSATLALFESARSPAPANAEAAAQAAEKSGQFQQAFLSYLSAYQSLPNPAPLNDDRRLRERIITVVQKLGTAPIVPREAIDHARKADQLLEAEAVLGGSAGASSTSAAAELKEAIRIAPWWPDATFKLATVLQRLQRVDEALLNLNLYKLADPQGAAAAIAARTAAPPPAAMPTRALPVAPKAGSATVTVYRSWNYFGSSNRVNIDCNGQRIAELQNSRVVTFKVPAGKHTLKFEGDDEMQVEVEAGRDYYFRSSVGGMGFNTRAVAADEAKAYLKEKTPKANDKKRTMATECKAFAQ